MMLRRISLLFLSVIMVVSAFSQTPSYTVHLIGPLAQYRGAGTNLKIPFLQILSADANQTIAGTGYIGKKYPLIIGFHGAGEKTTSYSSASTVSTGNITSLFNTSLPSLLRYTSSTLYNKRYAAVGRTDSTSFCYLFPQTYGGYRYTYQTYPYNMIKYAKDSLSHIIDTNRIYLAGLSLGGGAVLIALQDTAILKDVAGAIANCSGYINPAGVTPYNFQALSQWGGLLILTHSTNDSVTDKNPATREGSYYSDRARDSIYKYPGYITHLIYKRWTTGGHNGIWDRAYNPANSVNIYPQSNGQNSAFDVNFHSYLLSYSRTGDGKIEFSLWLVLCCIPFKRRKKNKDE
jgi:hypothetical protein